MDYLHPLKLAFQAAEGWMAADFSAAAYLQREDEEEQSEREQIITRFIYNQRTSWLKPIYFLWSTNWS